MLYYPWYDEDIDLLGGCATYQEQYRLAHAVMHDNECKEDSEIDEDGPPEHL